MRIAEILLNDDGAIHVPVLGKTQDPLQPASMVPVLGEAGRPVHVAGGNGGQPVVGRNDLVPEIAGAGEVVVDDELCIQRFDHLDEFRIVVFAAQDHQAILVPQLRSRVGSSFSMTSFKTRLCSRLSIHCWLTLMYMPPRPVMGGLSFFRVSKAWRMRRWLSFMISMPRSRSALVIFLPVQSSMDFLNSAS